MSRTHWLTAAALAMFIAAPAMSQQPAPPTQTGAGTIHVEGQPAFQFQQVGPNVTFRAAGGGNATYSNALPGDPLPSKYWLGIYCSPIPPALRAHVTLPEKNAGQIAFALKIQ